ncbi:MAG: ATP-binding protein [Thermodesulfobacteriota bacterium]
MKYFRLFPSTISFRGALLIYVVAPLIGALGIFGYLALNTIEKQVESQMQKDLELVARAVQLPLSYALEKDRMGSIMQALESVFSIGRVYSAYIYDKEGKEIATLGLADPEPEPERLTELAADGESRGEYGLIAGRNVYSYFVPLTDTGGRINGLLQLTRRGREFSDDIRSIRIKGGLSLGVLLVLLSAVVLYGHHRALGMHLARLNSSMSRIARGERGHRFDHQGPKEIIELGESFNHMLNSIEEAERAIMAHRLSQEKLEKRLRQSEKMAALGTLAAGTAHELGTPLSVISGKAQRALRQEGISEVQRRTLADIREEVTRMEHIIRQLLDFSRRGPFRCSPASPASMAASAVSAVEEEAKACGAVIKLTGDGNTPPVVMDAIRIHQALSNLLRNAIQCSPAGNIRVSWEQKDDGVCFGVEDDGPGVPTDNRARIFEPFFTTRPVGEGTGLGLAVVHSVAEEHGGWVEVSEGEMGGAFFRLTIPSQPNSK